MLKFNCHKVFADRGINDKLGKLRSNGFTYHQAHRILSENQNSISFAVLEKFCLLLNCTPNDLLEWTPDKPEQDTELTSLKVLKTDKKQNINVAKILQNLPYEKLEEIARLLQQGGK